MHVFIYEHAAFSNYRCCLYSVFSVVGGKNIYLRLSVSGKCDNKDSVWEMLQKEVLYSVALRVFNLGKNCVRKNKIMVAGVVMRDGDTWGGCGRGFPPLAGVVQGASPGKILNICMLQGVTW